MLKVCPDSLTRFPKAELNTFSLSELHTLRHLLSDIYDPLTSATKRQAHVHPVVRSLQIAN